MPTKNKGPLTKVEKFYLENNPDLSSKQLAQDIGRTAKAIEKHLGSLKKDDEYITQSKNETSDDVAGDLMSRNEKYGVTVMNEQASAAGELSKKPKATFNPKTMHKIKDN
jgi:hypothetical protein